MSSKLDKIVPLSSIQPEDLTKRDKLSTGIPYLDAKLLGGIYMGQLVTVTGLTGKGKSTFCHNLVAQAFEQGYKSLIYSGELSDDSIASSLVRIIAGPEHIVEHTSPYGYSLYTVKPEIEQRVRKLMSDRIYLLQGDTDREEILETVEAAITELGVKVVLIDNLMTVVPDSIEMYMAQSQTAKALATLAIKTGAIIILVAHPKKSADSKTNGGIGVVSGSQHIEDRSHIVMQYSLIDPKDDFKQPTAVQPVRKLVLSKVRIGGHTCEVGIPLGYDPASTRVYDATKSATWAWHKIKPETHSQDAVKPIFEI